MWTCYGNKTGSLNDTPQKSSMKSSIGGSIIQESIFIGYCLFKSYKRRDEIRTWMAYLQYNSTHNPSLARRPPINSFGSCVEGVRSTCWIKISFITSQKWDDILIPRNFGLCGWRILDIHQTKRKNEAHKILTIYYLASVHFDSKLFT